MLDRPVEIFDLFGQPNPITLRGILLIIVNRYTLLFLLAVWIAQFAADPPNLRQAIPLWQTALYWPIALVIYIGVILSLIFLACRLPLSGDRVALYMPLLGITGSVAAVAICENAVHHVSDGAHPIKIEMFFFAAILSQVYETVFLRFVLPVIRTGDMTSPPPSPSIRLGGRDIAIGSISYITAEEHFVHLETEEGCITHRARISDIVAQLPPELGVQPHRSWWVSRQSNPRLDREGNRHVLHLGCGLSVPVARARIPKVTAWFEQQHN